MRLEERRIHCRGALAPRDRFCEPAKREQRRAGLVLVLRGGLERSAALVAGQCLFESPLIAQRVAET